MKIIKITAGLMGAAIVGLGVVGLVEDKVKVKKEEREQEMKDMLDEAIILADDQE